MRLNEELGERDSFSIVIKTRRQRRRLLSLSGWGPRTVSRLTVGLIIRQGRVASRSLLCPSTEGKPQKPTDHKSQHKRDF